MPDPGLIKWVLIGLAILFAISVGISAVIMYWYWFALGGAAIFGAVYAIKYKNRIANRV